MRFKPGQRVQMKKVFPEEAWRNGDTGKLQGRVVTLVKLDGNDNGWVIKEDNGWHWYPFSCFADEIYEDGVEDILCNLE